MKGEKEVQYLVSHVYCAVEKHGAKKVITHLNELNESNYEFLKYEADLFSYIVKASVKVFKMKFDDLKKPHIRGDKQMARKMCFILLKKHWGKTHLEILQPFGKANHAIVSHALTEFANMSLNIKSEKDFIDKYNKIDGQIEHFKRRFWDKHNKE